MRVLTYIAFIAIQLSVFTCGFNIHVHAMDFDQGHIAEHLHHDTSNHDKGSLDHGCHVHASHTFHTFDTAHTHTRVPAAMAQHYVLSETHWLKIPMLIEHPPKTLHS